MANTHIKGLSRLLFWTAATVAAVVVVNALAKYVMPAMPEGTAVSFRTLVVHGAPATEVVNLREVLEDATQVELDRPPANAKRLWMSLRAGAPVGVADAPWVIYWPSRHITNLDCWPATAIGDVDSAVFQSGSSAALEVLKLPLESLRPGYAYYPAAGTQNVELTCAAQYLGPARITTRVMTADQLHARMGQKDTQGNVLLSAIGALVVFTLLIAIASRSSLYGTLAAWLAVNLAMAAFSGGMDTRLYEVIGGVDIAHDIKKVVTAAYLALTVLLFMRAFAQELASLAHPRIVRALRSAIGLALVGAVILPYNYALLFLWSTAAGCAFAGTWLMIKILGAYNSKAARWYVASIMATISGTVGEVVSAATGGATPLGGIDSISAALLAAVLTSLAIAEQFNASQKKAIDAERRLRKAYDESPVGLLTLDPDGGIAYANQACSLVLKHGRGLVGKSLGDFVGQGNLQSLLTVSTRAARVPKQWQFRCQLGESKAACILQVTATLGESNAIDATLQDVTAAQSAHELLSHLAHHDPLTDALNRRGLMHFQDQLLQEASSNLEAGRENRGAPSFSLAFLDLDKFKLINDLHGHAIGDEVLQQTCTRIRNLLLPGDAVARVGGDEFVLLLDDRDKRDLTAVCELIIHAITQVTFLVQGLSLKVGISIGLINQWKDHFAGLSEALSSADTLCRTAKRKDGLHLICADPDSPYFGELRDQLYISSFLDNNQAPPNLYLLMQPELSIRAPSSSLNFEILIRMRRQDESVIPAQRIISAAESLGKSSIIDRWVVETALAWIDTHWEKLANTQFIGVNLSGGSLNDIAFMSFLNMCFETHRQALSKVLFEITETVALADIEGVKSFVRQAKEQGAKFALDDFGAGFSSFGYLKGLPADALKLDGSLISGAISSPASMAIIANVSRLSTDLGMKCIAEYVEDVETLDMLADAGVDYAQGYAVSPPVAPEVILSAHSTFDLVVDDRVRSYLESSRDQAELPLLQ